jgi:hypothetical protein
MANEKRLIDANALTEQLNEYIQENREENCCANNFAADVCEVLKDIYVKEAPTVDAVVMPKGKPGDFLEWDNGTGFKQIYCIHSVMICEDCMRYELANFTPVVNHPNIVRILSKEEAEKEWKERCARERAEEEPTLTACAEKMG